MSREEAAAKARYEEVTGKPWESAPTLTAKLCREGSAAIVKAADAHDQANGIHRVAMDDAAIFRATRVVDAFTEEQFACFVTFKARDALVRAVLAALEGIGE